ncbi:MAG TPA: sigma-70 family RNA polymerase sigma factor [Candidatus Saccharimonadales bacterium]|nr:sigma-70 family RNA polymerase sigma factor [Candidatus Saccharimonadales bacterium]
MGIELERHGEIIDAHSLDFLVEVLPVLEMPQGFTGELSPFTVSRRLEILAQRAETLATELETPNDQRVALFSATLLRTADPQSGEPDLHAALEQQGYIIEAGQLPLVAEHTAAWLCGQFVSTKEPIEEPLASVIQFPLREILAEQPSAVPTQKPASNVAKEAPKGVSFEAAPKTEKEQDIARDDEMPTEDELAKESAGIDLVRLYIRQATKRPLLTAEQEVELAKSIEAGLFAQDRLDKAVAQDETLPVEDRRDLQQLVRAGERDKTHLIEANTRLVITWAKRYRGSGLSYLDLIQEGNLGLIRAVEKFDYQRGFKFSSYATRWIRQSISRALADQGRVIRIPVHRQDEISRLNRTKNDLLRQLNREPTLAEVAAESGFTKKQVRSLLNDARTVWSLDVPVGEDGKESLGDFLAEQESMSTIDEIGDQVTYEKVDALVQGILTNDELAILRARFATESPVPFTELAEQLSLKSVPYHMNRALAKLAHPVTRLVLESHTGADDREAWREEASCEGLDPASFFERTEEDKELVQRVCFDCPVREQCRDHALDKDIKVGIWGGLRSYERAKGQREMSPSVAARIRKFKNKRAAAKAAEPTLVEVGKLEEIHKSSAEAQDGITLEEAMASLAKLAIQ